MSVIQNFTGFWNLWRDSTVKRDYQLLDKIHPNRIRSAEEWIRKTGFNGSHQTSKSSLPVQQTRAQWIRVILLPQTSARAHLH